MNDEIFLRRVPLEEDEWEPLEDWSRCGTCGDSSKKLKNCQFCGNLTCPTCVQHQKHFPVDNQDRERLATQVCFVCVSKFLYRTAMYEMISRLELKNEEIAMYQQEAHARHLQYETYLAKTQKQKNER